MRLFLIRHGDPDYENDCLTALGKSQAAAMAERMQDEGVTEIYSSASGRALATAGFLSEKIHLPVTSFEDLRELRWDAAEGASLPNGGNPWRFSEQISASGGDLTFDWYACKPLCRSYVAKEDRNRVIGCFDGLMETLGYRREGSQYRVVGDGTDKTVALVCHAGVSVAVFSHLFHLPLMQAFAMFHIACTSVTLLEWSNEKDLLISPRFHYVGDYHHILDIGGYHR